MRHGIRPASRPAVLRDRAAGFPFLTRSALDSGRTVEGEDGTTCPVADVEIPSASHPFRTGTARVLGHRGTRGALRAAPRHRSGPPLTGTRPFPGALGPPQEYVMKVRKSLRSLKARPGAQVVRRRGVTFVINKKDPRSKARQG